MSKVDLDQFKQHFNSPKVNLEITSFKTQKEWLEIIKDKGFKDIWDLIEWIAPVELFNVHNFQLIEKRFVKTPTRARIIKFLRERDYYAVVKLNLHDPQKGYSIVIHESIEAARVYKYSRPTTFKLAKDKMSFSIQDFTTPTESKTTMLVNPFVFYDEFAHYNAVGLANQGLRTFVISDGTSSVTDKLTIGTQRKFNWRGIAFENTVPVRDRSRSKYHVIEDTLKALRNNSSFFDVFYKVNQLINGYVMSANNDKHRQTLAESYQPIPYNDSEILMKELRFRRSRLGMLNIDFDRCFTPYLEIGTEPHEFVMGVISR